MSSAAAVLRSAACHALRRPPFPRAAALIGRQPPPFPRAQNWNMRRFYSSDDRGTTAVVGKPPAETNYGSVSRKLDKVNCVFSEYNAAVNELAELLKEKAERDWRNMVVRRRIVLAGGVLAAVYVKRRFFSGGTGTNKEDDGKEMEMETAANI